MFGPNNLLSPDPGRMSTRNIGGEFNEPISPYPTSEKENPGMSAKFLIHILALCLLTAPTIAATNAQENVVIYFAGADGLFRTTGFDQPADRMHYSQNAAYRFSNDGQRVAFGDEAGLWVSDLNTWEPHSIVKSHDPARYELYWTPDDTRVIAWVFYTSENLETVVFNLNTQQTEVWPWNNCDHGARHRLTGQLVLVCLVAAGDTDTTPSPIALEWGGAYSAFTPEEYETLTETPVSRTSYTLHDFNRLDWVNNGTLMAYADPDETLETLSVATGDNTVIPLIVTDYYAIGNVAFSPNNQLVAFTESCAGAGSEQCFHVADITTREFLWSYSEYNSGLDMLAPLDVAWYPDSSQVAVLGFALASHDANVWIVDLEDRSVHKYPLEHPADSMVILSSSEKIARLSP
jgi:WD40 repeat protein